MGRKALIIYHQASKGILCPDGAMAAAIAHGYFSTYSIEHSFMGDTYRNAADYPESPDFKLPAGLTDLVIVDFSYPRSWLDYWQSSGLEVKILDHHQPKFQMIGDFSGAILDEKECGATLAWKYFFPGVEAPDLLLHVKRRDIGADGYYEGRCVDSEEINEGLGARRNSAWKQAGDSVFGVLWALLELPGFVKDLRVEGRELLVIRDQIVEAACDRCSLVEMSDFLVPFVDLTEKEARYHSAIGNALCKRHSSSPFSWTTTPDGSNHLRSARDVSDFDVSVVARRFGGDGHRNAAGFRPRETVNQK